MTNVEQFKALSVEASHCRAHIAELEEQLIGLADDAAELIATATPEERSQMEREDMAMFVNSLEAALRD